MRRALPASVVRGTLVVVAALSCLRCGPPPPPPDGGVSDGGDPVIEGPVELGTTDDAGTFVALSGPVDGIPGSQGGFHVNLLYRLPRGAVGSITVDHQVRRVRDERLVSRGTRMWDVGLTRVPTWETPSAVTVFMCPTPVGVDIIGEALRFTVTAKDAAGQPFATGSATATFRCGTSAGAFCASICKG
jgi:hypothetical protein